MSRNSDFIPFALPSMGREEEEAVLAVLRSGWLTTGTVTKAFEEEFAAYVGATPQETCDGRGDVKGSEHFLR